MITVERRAADLPSEWDEVVGDNLYLRRDFLAFLEHCEDCGQRYHLVRDADGRLDTVFLTYVRRGYNLSMFTRFDLRVRMTFVYVPLSVTRPGIAWGACRDEALAYIRGLRGYTLVLNLPPGDYPGFATGLTCSQCVLRVRWGSFDEYLASLRSHYRHRYRKALKASAGLRLRWLADGSEFDERLYALYRQVVDRSRLVIEVLPIKFFRAEYFRILVLEDGDGPVGFVQLLGNGDELIFEFVGFDYASNHRYDTYVRLLLEIVRYGIEHGFTTIDFGQTADDTKLKLGCDYSELYAALHHSNPLVRWGARRLAPLLQYRPLTTEFQVFREDVTPVTASLSATPATSLSSRARPGIPGAACGDPGVRRDDEGGSPDDEEVRPDGEEVRPDGEEVGPDDEEVSPDDEVSRDHEADRAWLDEEGAA